MSHFSFHLSTGVQTHAGMRRDVNEDAVLVADPFYLVADGVGGHEGGARASRAALAAFEHSGMLGHSATLQGIDQAINEARSAVKQVRDSGASQAGSTLSGVIRLEHERVPHWYVVNIGDSRVYLWRAGGLVQLTTDHSLQCELAAAGDPSAHLAPKNVITRALGAEDERHDSWLLPLEAGSRLVVCSDGLTDDVGDAEIGRVLATAADAQRAADVLLTAALAAGARDNVTIAVVDVSAAGGTSGVDDLDTTIEQ